MGGRTRRKKKMIKEIKTRVSWEKREKKRTKDNADLYT